MAFTINTSQTLADSSLAMPVHLDHGNLPVVKNEWPERNPDSMTAHFGRIELAESDIPSERWVRRAITKTRLPWKTFASWDRDIRIELLHLNNGVTQSLHRICARILGELGPEAIEKNGLDLIGRCGGYGLEEGRSTLSPHAWGAAIMFDPARNPYQSRKPKTRGCHISDEVVSIFEDEGWHWGGRNEYHFQPSTFSATKN